MLMENLKVDFEYEDERGTLTQLVRRGYSQINVVTTKKGVVRGGHYHKMNTEAFFLVSGSCRVSVSKDDITEVATYHAGDFFRIGPYVMHDFEYLEDTIMVTMYSLGAELDDGTMDMYTMENE